jgi:uncharacterized protein
LNSDNGAKSLFASGVLSKDPPHSGADFYIYDPLDLRRGEQVENIPYNASTTNIDQRLASSINGDGLIYQSDPMEKEVWVTGFPALSLWLSMDVPDTDIEANLYEVLPDGVTINIWSDVLRARYPESERSAKLGNPGEINRYYFDPRFFVARRLAPARACALKRFGQPLVLEPRYPDQVRVKKRRSRKRLGRPNARRAG